LAIALPALLRFMTSNNPFGIYKLLLSVDLYTHRYAIPIIKFISLQYICKNILKITIIWHNELFNGKGLKAKHNIFVGLFHSNAGKNVIYKFS
jgi:hypothetical protein